MERLAYRDCVLLEESGFLKRRFHLRQKVGFDLIARPFIVMSLQSRISQRRPRPL